MTRNRNIILTIFIALTACSSPTVNNKPNLSADTSIVELTSENNTNDSTDHKNKIQPDSLPIHGALNQKQIEQYYPKILDTIKDRRIIGSEPIDIQNTADIYVSMLHNTGTNDQMFLCTHDKKFKLLDCYYIGLSTMFDKTSHTIDFKKVNDNCLEFHHVDWGYVKRNGEDEIDTLKYRKYMLTIAKTGKIEKK